MTTKKEIDLYQWSREKSKAISEMPEVKKMLELEIQAINALDEACEIAGSIGISHYFDVSPLYQLYACERSDSKLFQAFKDELVGAIDSKTGKTISEDDAVEILRDFNEFNGGEGFGGWQHSAVC